MLDLAAPVKPARARRQDLDEHVVLVAQSCLVVREIHRNEIAREHILRVMAQVIGERLVRERRVETRGLHRQTIERIESLEHTRFEHLHEIALAHQQRAFVLFHHMTLPHIHSCPFLHGPPADAHRTDRGAARAGGRGFGRRTGARGDACCMASSCAFARNRDRFDARRALRPAPAGTASSTMSVLADSVRAGFEPATHRFSPTALPE